MHHLRWMRSLNRWTSRSLPSRFEAFLGKVFFFSSKYVTNQWLYVDIWHPSHGKLSLFRTVMEKMRNYPEMVN